MRLRLLVLGIVAFLTSVGLGASPFKKVFIVVFENMNYEEVLADPFFGELAGQGVLFTEFYAEVHPSQPNYIALISGSTHGVLGDGPKDIDARHVGDLLEEHGRTWKVYAEGYPGDCFTGSSYKKYVRKHNPFISFKNVQKSKRCRNIVEASVLASDIDNGTLPDYSFYVPDINNDGHDTGLAFASRWYAKTFGPLIQNPKFMKDMLLITTFDESEGLEPTNHIYTVFNGDSVISGSTFEERVNHYSLLRTIEDLWGLGSLGLKDKGARAITGIWKKGR